MKRLTGWQRALALVFAGLFALSAAMTGTAAWADLSQHRTNIAGGNGPPKPADALLQKYEIDTEIPVPGAHFALFRGNPDGTADLIEPFITGPDGQVLASQLEPGDYYWQETAPAPGFLPETGEDGQAKKYPFSIPTEDGEPPLTIVYNTRQRGSLTVSKMVLGEGADLNMAFNFTAVIGGRTEMFTLRHGHSMVFEDIPVGTAYEVVETPAAGYITSSENNTGSVPAQGVTAAFTNTFSPPATGSLIVTKVVTGQGADPAKAFEFTVVIGGETQAFTLTHGLSKYFDNLPVGTQYTVTEKDYADDGYTIEQRARSGEIQAAGGLVHLVYVNEYGPPEPEKGSLVVTKAVTGAGDRNKPFSFTAAIGGETETFILKHGESKIFTDIPAGTAYTVTEGDYAHDGYTASFVPSGGNSGVIVGGQAIAFVCVNNKLAAQPQITVTKQVQGNPPESDSEKLFRFTLTVNGTPHEFDLKAGETSQPFTVHAGDVYSLAEQDAPGYLKSGVVNGSGTVGGVNINIVQVNTYLGPETIDIEGEKTWLSPGPPAAIQLPASVTVLLKNGNVTVRTAVITAENNWRYEFTSLPKHDALGNVIPYTVEELRIPGWRPVATGYDIKNHHQPPVTGGAVEVEKAVAGTPPADAAFSFDFLLTPVNQAPMPDSNEITITGAGKASFGQITYDTPGTYIYTVTEKPGSLANWSYDASVYTLTVTVSEDEDWQLAAAQTLTKTGQATDRALFTNHYSLVPEVIDVRVTKVWQGGSEHPQSVQAQLYRDGTAYGNPATLSAANHWTRVWPGLEKGHIWTVDEVGVPEGYAKTVSGDAVNGFAITNTKGAPPETTDLKVTKVWKGEDEGRPASVAMQLYKNGEAAGVPVTLSEGNGWTYTWNGLEKRPASPGGEPYAWTVDEVNVPAGYVKGITGDAANGFVVTNTKITLPYTDTEEIALNGKKTWNHEDNPMDKRPQSITVIIKADGAIVAQRLITAAEHWAWSFKLPKYSADGREIKYTVDEARFEDYVKTVDGYNLINTYRPGGNTDDPFKPTLPRTDDESKLTLWLTLAFVSLAALALTVIPWKKMKGRRKHDP